MHDNVLIGVILVVAFVTPVFAWFFYLWYRSHITQMHQESQIYDRRNRDRAHANYEPANGAPNPVTGPYFTPRGWVRPKTRGSSHVLRPPQYVHPRQPIFTGIPHSDQHFQGPNRANTHSPQTVNQQPNPLSKRQQRKRRALQNKQRQQEQQQRGQQQSQIDQGGKQNRKNQRKQKNKNQGQNQQKSPIHQSPKAQSPKFQGQDEQNNQWGNTVGQHEQTTNHDGRSGWGNDRNSCDSQRNTGWNDNNNHWSSNSNNERGGQRNSVSHSPRRNSRDNQNNPPDRASRNEVESRGWGQSDDGAQQNSHPRSNHSKEDHHDRNDGWGDNDTKSYKKSKDYRYASLEGTSRGRSSPNRDWGHNDHGEQGNSCNRSNSWGHAEEQHGGGNESWSQDGNMHRDPKEKKERWQIELEENEKRRRSLSPPGGSDAGWDKCSRASGWKKTQKW
ncbi:hypothetical protein N7517_001999 [Penicillium concentricum]|uniref:Uncharacterized protein n=1 Tax=Penicillium concentricum TaxID=293559 RepID=A0A9W9SWU5_9EURO|nr:uncharacterized protein N7517_001999 [Penicillium concentricum]KAJ5384088.1 hypothetical protein N7517_001999 [Penicillium concentricum]